MSFGKFKDDKEAGKTPAPAPRAGRASSDASLGVGSKIVGRLNFEGAAEIGGEVEGEIVSEGRLTISETAKIKARIQGTEIIVKGTIEGDVIATKKLALLRPARVSGNISSATISIEEGVLFEGSCEMIQSQSSPASTSVKSTAVKTQGNGKSTTGTTA